MPQTKQMLQADFLRASAFRHIKTNSATSIAKLQLSRFFVIIGAGVFFLSWWQVLGGVFIFWQTEACQAKSFASHMLARLFTFHLLLAR